MHPAQHVIFIFFLFALGASVGSFLNVVVWRLPRIQVPLEAGFWRSIGLSFQGLSTPPSHCPKCGHQLAWKDNIPVFGWLFLRGKCRYCGTGISARYPVIEFVTGALFVFYYVAFFFLDLSPCAPQMVREFDDLFDRIVLRPRLMTGLPNDWPIYGLYMFMIAALLAISLIDAELFIIPVGMPWLMAAVGIVVHTLVDRPTVPGAVLLTDPQGISHAMAAGGAIGLALSIGLFHRKFIPLSFPEGEPSLEVDEDLYAKELEQAKKEGREPPARPPVYTSKQIRAEIRKEILFLLPPLLCALAFVVLTQGVPVLRESWQQAIRYHWLSGFLGAVLGALVGGLVVWAARIFGTLGFGRVSMGLGDVHLMFGVGAVVGAGAATVAFFLAPFAAILIGLYMLLTRKRHELPYGPYLSFATAGVLLFYCPIEAWLAPGMQGLGEVLRGLTGAN